MSVLHISAELVNEVVVWNQTCTVVTGQEARFSPGAVKVICSDIPIADVVCIAKRGVDVRFLRAGFELCRALVHRQWKSYATVLAWKRAFPETW